MTLVSPAVGRKALRVGSLRPRANFEVSLNGAVLGRVEADGDGKVLDFPLGVLKENDRVELRRILRPPGSAGPEPEE